MKAALRLLREFLRAYPEQAAAELERIDAREAAAVLADAPPDEAAPALAAMSALAAAEALEHMEIPSAVALLCRLDAPVAAMLLRRQTLPLRQNVLFICPEPWKASIEAGVRTGPGSVAALMDPRAPVFPVDWKVSELVQYLTAHPGRMAPEVFVEDRDHKLRGRIELRALEGRLNVRELRGVMAPEPPAIPLRAAVAAVREDELWRRFDVLPVVDESGRFVGSLSHRALRMDCKPDRGRGQEKPGAAMVELAELAWTGYLAAFDVASAIARSVTAPNAYKAGPDGQKDQS